MCCSRRPHTPSGNAACTGGVGDYAHSPLRAIRHGFFEPLKRKEDVPASQRELYTYLPLPTPEEEGGSPAAVDDRFQEAKDKEQAEQAEQAEAAADKSGSGEGEPGDGTDGGGGGGADGQGEEPRGTEEEMLAEEVADEQAQSEEEQVRPNAPAGALLHICRHAFAAAQFAHRRTLGPRRPHIVSCESPREGM